MKLQKIAAGARAFSLPPFLEKALGSRLKEPITPVTSYMYFDCTAYAGNVTVPVIPIPDP